VYTFPVYEAFVRESVKVCDEWWCSLG